MSRNQVEIVLKLGAADFRRAARQSEADFGRAVRGMRTDSQRFRQALEVLDFKTGPQIRREVRRVEAAYGRLVRSGQLSFADQRRAQEQVRRKIAEIRSESARTSPVVGELRNQLIGIFSIAAAARFVRSIIQARLELERIQRALTAATGSSEAAAREFGFVEEQADRLGLNLRTAARDFSQLAAAARGTRAEGKVTRDVFLGVAEAGAVLGLSVDAQGRALTALTQIISKGRVQAEELVGQLGEPIPGALQIAARAMDTTTASLLKLVETGEVDAIDFVAKFGRQLRREFADQVPQATDSTQAALNRLSNAIFEAQNDIAESGFIDTVGDLARGLAAIARLVQPVVFGLRSIGAIKGFETRLLENLLTLDFAGIGRDAQALGEQLAFEFERAFGERRVDEAERQERELAERRRSIRRQLSADEQRIAQEQLRLEEANKERRIEFEREVARERVAAFREAIREQETLLRQNERENEELLERSRRLREEIAGIELSVEQRIRERRRRELSPEERQLDIAREAAQAITEARRALREGDFETAERLARRVQALSDAIEETRTANALLIEGAQLQREAKEQEIQSIDAAREANARANAELRREIATAKELADGLARSIKSIGEADPRVEIRDNIAEVTKRVRELRRQLAAVGGAEVNVSGQGLRRGGTVGPVRAAVGRFLPGYGGGDRRVVLAEDGEFVLRKEAVRRYGLPFIQGLNAMRVEARRSGGRVLPAPPSLPRFQDGGAVAGGAPPDTVRLKLDLGRGGGEFDLFGERDQVVALRDALVEASRGG